MYSIGMEEVYYFHLLCNTHSTNTLVNSRDIVSVRIYIDTFTPDKDDTNSSIPNTGDYRVTLFTGCMIYSCTMYLPIASSVAYIKLNKLWLSEVFLAINMLNVENHSVPTQYPLYKKLFAFFKDLLAHITVVFLMLPFIIAFTVAPICWIMIVQIT